MLPARTVLLFPLLYMLNRIAYFMVRPGLVLHMHQPPDEGGLGLEVVDIGALLGDQATAFMVSLWVGVLFVAVLGARVSAVLGTGMLSAAYLGLIVAPSDAVLLPILILGAGLGIAKPALLVLTAQATLGRERGFGSWVQVFLLMYVAMSLGGFLGPVVLGLLRRNGTSLPFVFGVAALIAAVVGVGLALIPSAPRQKTVPRISGGGIRAGLAFLALALGLQIAYPLAFVDEYAVINMALVIPVCLLAAFAQSHFLRVGTLQIIGLGLGLVAIATIAGLDGAVGMVLLSLAEVLAAALILGRLATCRNPGFAALMVVLWTTASQLGDLVSPSWLATNLLRGAAGVWCLLGGLVLAIWGPRLQSILRHSYDAEPPEPQVA